MKYSEILMGLIEGRVYTSDEGNDYRYGKRGLEVNMGEGLWVVSLRSLESLMKRDYEEKSK